MERVFKGQIYLAHLKGIGSEQQGKRPVVILQNNTGNKYSPTTIVAALTAAIEKPYPFLVRITAKESGLPKDSMINLSAILTIDKARLVNKSGQLGKQKMAEVDEAIKASLGL